MQRLDGLKLPLNPLDDLIDRLGGPRRVAEMTGRNVRQVCERGEWVLEKRLGSKDCEDTINIQERKNFMSGKKLVAIISGQKQCVARACDSADIWCTPGDIVHVLAPARN